MLTIPLGFLKPDPDYEGMGVLLERVHITLLLWGFGVQGTGFTPS
jgi:hypothetical protein